MSSLIVSRTNRAINPRATGGGAQGWTTIRGWATGGNGSYTYVTTATPPPTGVASVRRKTWSQASSDSYNCGFLIYSDAANYIAVTAGEVITVSVWMRHTSATQKNFVVRLSFWNQVAVSGATAVGSTLTGTGVAAPGGATTTWYLVQHTVSVPTGALGMSVYADLANVDNPGFAVNDIVDATCLLVEAAPLANDYFDGSTTDTAALLYDWDATVNNSISRQTNVVDWRPDTPTTKNLLSYWDAGAWQQLSQPGIPGPQGPTGPEGIRTSCGGCRIKGSQSGQPTGAIWDVDQFVVDPTWSTDPNPCIGISASNELQILRNTSSLIITATLTMTNSRINSRSYMAITFQPSGYIIGRCSITQTEDSVSLTILSQFSLGDKIRVQTYLNTTVTPIAYTCYVTAALSP